MLSQILAIVAAPEAVGAERLQPPAKPWRDLPRHHLHIIGGGDDRSFGVPENLHDKRCFGGLVRMQAIPPLDPQRLAAQLVVAGDAPYIRRDSKFLRQEV